MAKKLLSLFGGLVVVGFVVALFAGLMSVRIVGNRNVACYSTLGQISTKESPPGVKILIPAIQTIKTVPVVNQTLDYKGIPVLTKDGLQINLDLTVWYRINKNMACDAYLQYGDIEGKLVVPTIRAAIREVSAEFVSSDFYASREEVNRRVQAKLTGLNNEYFTVVDVRIRDIKLPKQVVDAIQQKLVAQQESERMKFVLEREKQEAERKRVEAKGIADANRIISDSLTQEYLQWYQIEAIKQLANSPNSTFMIVPYGQNLIPGLNAPMLTKEVK